MPLLKYLRSEGVAGLESARQLGPVDQLVGEYRAWLMVDRRLAPDTVSGYMRLAARFLIQRSTVSDELGLHGLTGGDVTGFLLAESGRLKPGSVRFTPISCVSCCAI